MVRVRVRVCIVITFANSHLTFRVKTLLCTVPVVAELLALQEKISPFMFRVGVITNDCNVTLP